MKYGKIIGLGNTAAEYEWGQGKVLKLFYQGYPKEAVEKEFHNAKAISNMDFANECYQRNDTGLSISYYCSKSG